MWIPANLRVKVSMQVNKSGGHDPAAGVDFLPCFAVNGANGADNAVIDGDVCLHRVGAGAIIDGAIADNHVVHLRDSSACCHKA